MAFTIKWSEEALEDIESIAAFIEKDSPIYAKSVVSKFGAVSSVQAYIDNTL